MMTDRIPVKVDGRKYSVELVQSSDGCVATENEALRDQLGALQSKNMRLRDCLEQALEWNWLDDDAPQDVLAMCENALKENDNEP